MKFNDYVTIWRGINRNEFNDMEYPSPIHSIARWEDSQQLYTTIDGSEYVSKAVIFLPSDVVVAVEDYIIKGTYKDFIKDESSQIKSISRIPNLRGTKEVVTLWV